MYTDESSQGYLPRQNGDYSGVNGVIKDNGGHHYQGDMYYIVKHYLSLSQAPEPYPTGDVWNIPFGIKPPAILRCAGDSRGQNADCTSGGVYGLFAGSVQRYGLKIDRVQRAAAKIQGGGAALAGDTVQQDGGKLTHGNGGNIVHADGSVAWYVQYPLSGPGISKTSNYSLQKYSYRLKGSRYYPSSMITYMPRGGYPGKFFLEAALGWQTNLTVYNDSDSAKEEGTYYDLLQYFGLVN
jgi:prepilin-type processing-associated H-X9-DG protein